MTAPRILVTGSRRWNDPTRIAHVLKGVRDQDHFADAVLVHGDAVGADRMAAAAWISLGGRVEPHPARWSQCARDCPPRHMRGGVERRRYCPTAGHRRNRRMVELGADLCLAFVRDNSRGSTQCRELAEKAGIPVLSFDLDRPADEGVWS